MPFARHQNVYLRRYRVYIRSTVRVHYITARCSQGAPLNRVADGISRPYHPAAPAGAYRFQGGLVYPDMRRRGVRCVLPRESRHRSYPRCASPRPPHPREPVRSRALLMGRINFVIKSSWIITEHDRGRLDRPAVPRHDEIIKDQLQRALSAG